MEPMIQLGIDVLHKRAHVFKREGKPLGIWSLSSDACLEDPALSKVSPYISFSPQMVNLLLQNGAEPYFNITVLGLAVWKSISQTSDRAIAGILPEDDSTWQGIAD